MAQFQNYSPVTQGLPDVGACLDFIAKQKQVQPGKIGLTGYCMGGSLAVRAAAQYPDRIAVATSFHGGNLATEEPTSPHLQIKKIQAKVYIAHADNDQSMPPEQIARLDAEIKESGNGLIHAELYPGAVHGFTMADLPAYSEVYCNKHYEKVFELFGSELAGRKAA